MISGYGKLKELKPDSFLAPKDKNILTIYYLGINEKLPSYHQVILYGNAEKGYKVYGIFIDDKPLSEIKNYKKIVRNGLKPFLTK